jgi:hypothetical protein
MNLLEILRARIEALPVGDHLPGLRAVIQHVEVAVGHFMRGRTAGDPTAFTDAIYRTNQAFEGSLKEAYRVLAGQDPSKQRPYDLEIYFQQNARLRPRVLAQLTNYRTEWRNPATHDYRLDFDEDEALLAIVSVCAFAIVLTDQIAEKLSFEAVRTATAANPPVKATGPLVSRTAELLRQFASTYKMTADKSEPRWFAETELIGAIAGFLSAAMPGANVVTEAPLNPEVRLLADLFVGDSGQQVLVEVRQARLPARDIERAMQTITRYLDLSGIKEAIVYFHPGEPASEMILEDRRLPRLGARVLLLMPKKRSD